MINLRAGLTVQPPLINEVFASDREHHKRLFVYGLQHAIHETIKAMSFFELQENYGSLCAMAQAMLAENNIYPQEIRSILGEQNLNE